MKIDLHIHTKTGSDGALSIEEVFREARKRKIELLSITDHDSIEHQGEAIELAGQHGIRYITGVELNITFPYQGKGISLDLLGYGYDYQNRALKAKLRLIREHREKRARQIMENLNIEFIKERLPQLTEEDLRQMQEGVDGILSRPHIADYLVKRASLATARRHSIDIWLNTTFPSTR